MRVRYLSLFLLSVGIGPLLSVQAVHPIAQSLNKHSSSSESGHDVSSSEEDISDVNPYSQYHESIMDENLSKMYNSGNYKRAQSKNFLRFGKSTAPAFSNMFLDDSSEEKRGAPRNFIRFGRGPKQNFLRFGRRGDYPHGLQWEVDDDDDSSEELLKRVAKNYLRFSRASNRNFIRFGRSTKSYKNQDLNFLRFGRSLKKSNEKVPKNNSPCDDEEHSKDDEPKTPRSSQDENEARTKRSLTALYDDPEFTPHSPLWLIPFNDIRDENVEQESLDEQDMIFSPSQKRAHTRNFNRYGRDPLDLHFLRFGKRGSDEVPQEIPKVGGVPSTKNRPARWSSNSKNFLRFG